MKRRPLVSALLALALFAGQGLAAAHDTSDHGLQPGAAHCAVSIYAHGAGHGALPVPRKLRNAVTTLMKDDGYGDGYQYPHDSAGSYVPGETYLPDVLLGSRYYEPSDQGLERSIAERLERLREEGKKKQ